MGLPTTFQNMFCLFAFVLWLGSAGPENSPHLRWAKMGRSMANITVSSPKALLCPQNRLMGWNSGSEALRLAKSNFQGRVAGGEAWGVGMHHRRPRLGAWVGGGGSCCTIPCPIPRMPPKKGHPGWLSKTWPGWPHELTAEVTGSMGQQLCPVNYFPAPSLQAGAPLAKSSVDGCQGQRKHTKETQCLLAKTLHNNALDPSIILFSEPPP